MLTFFSLFSISRHRAYRHLQQTFSITGLVRMGVWALASISSIALIAKAGGASLQPTRVTPPAMAPLGNENPLQRLFEKELNRQNLSHWIPQGQTWWLEPAYPQQYQIMCGSQIYPIAHLKANEWHLTLSQSVLQQPKALLGLQHTTTGCQSWYTVRIHHEVATLTTQRTINPQEPFTNANSAWVIQDLPNPTHYITEKQTHWVAKTRLLPNQSVKNYQAKKHPDVLKQHPVSLQIHLPGHVLLKHQALAQQDGNIGEWIYLRHKLPSPKFPKLLKGRIIAPNLVEIHL